MDKVDTVAREISPIQNEWWKIIKFVTQGRDPRIVVQSDIFDKKVLRQEFQNSVSEGRSDHSFYRAVKALCGVGALERDGKGWRVIEGVNVAVRSDTRPESLKKKKRTTSPPSSTTGAVLKSPYEWYNLFQHITEGKDPKKFVAKDVLKDRTLKEEFNDYISGGKSDGAFLTAVNTLCEVGALKKVDETKIGSGWILIEKVTVTQKPDPPPKAKKASEEKAPPPSDIVTTPVEEPETIRATSPPSSPEELRQQSLSDKIEAMVAQELEPGYRSVGVFCCEGFVATVYKGLILPTSEGGGE